MVLALASGPMALVLALAPVALASKVQALALRAVLTIQPVTHMQQSGAVTQAVKAR